ncbi:hypothetical protein SAMN06297251_10165 [Fulvimarina manganoxydans]|uniref:Uncharacterized protein n=1 Tax=Fulvimarina manganoxydans TaxID=937218 RepID=A0A1W1Y952_9HYPH|nr:hypothetical protein [Fulvimarina manganoxydans]SMC32669.1 hypothetical protein SAMN06297251_10165 [Fulvimarina manganoxydans]
MKMTPDQQSRYTPFAARVVLFFFKHADPTRSHFFAPCVRSDDPHSTTYDDALALGMTYDERSGDLGTKDFEIAAAFARRDDVFVTQAAAEALAKAGHPVEFDLTNDEGLEISRGDRGRIRRLAVSTQKAIVELRTATEDEIRACYRGCWDLSVLDFDLGKTRNDEGFSPAHTWIGHFITSVAGHRYPRTLKTDAWAVRLGRHYRNQLSEDLQSRILSNRKKDREVRERELAAVALAEAAA